MIKADIKSALISKGRNPNDDFTTYANEIRAIVCNGNESETPDTPENPIIPEEPTIINEYLERYNWLQSDGSKYTVSYRPIVGSNTYKSKDVTMKTIIKVDSLNAIGSTTSVFGSSGLYNDVRQRQLNLVLKRLDDTTFAVGYFSCAEKDLASDNNSFVGTFNIGDTLNIEANENTITINDTVYTNPVSSIQTMNLVNFHILYSGSSNGDKQYNAQIAKVEYIANDTTYSLLVPAKVTKELPIELSYDEKVKAIGTIGMWDLKNEKFMTSSTDNNWSVNNYPLDNDNIIK